MKPDDTSGPAREDSLTPTEEVDALVNLYALGGGASWTPAEIARFLTRELITCRAKLAEAKRDAKANAEIAQFNYEQRLAKRESSDGLAEKAEETLILADDPKADAISFWRARARYFAEEILRARSGEKS